MKGQSEYLRTAQAAADAADRIIRRGYRGNFGVRYKADASPVTEVDIAAEAAIKRVLRKRFPTHGFYGEESGLDRGNTKKEPEFLWLVDPIDGTKGFVRGYPIFSVQIALMRRGRLVVGVSSAPCWNGGKGERMFAEKGRGAWLGSRQLQASKTRVLGKATLSTGNLASLARSRAWARLGRVIPQLHRIRGYGDFLHYHYLADGRIDAVVETNVNILDIAALTVIAREAGIRMTDLRGEPIGLSTTSVLAANASLHTILLKTLKFR